MRVSPAPIVLSALLLFVEGHAGVLHAARDCSSS
jgi:hypothetical protein